MAGVTYNSLYMSPTKCCEGHGPSQMGKEKAKMEVDATYRFVEPPPRGRIIVVASEEAAVLAQDGEEMLLVAAHDSVVVTLVDAGLDPASCLAYVEELLDLIGCVVGEAPFFDFAVAVGLVHGLARLLERRGPVRCVQVQDVDLLDLQGLEGDVNLVEDLRLAVAAGVPGHNLGVDGGPGPRSNRPKSGF